MQRRLTAQDVAVPQLPPRQEQPLLVHRDGHAGRELGLDRGDGRRRLDEQRGRPVRHPDQNVRLAWGFDDVVSAVGLFRAFGMPRRAVHRRR